MIFDWKQELNGWKKCLSGVSYFFKIISLRLPAWNNSLTVTIEFDDKSEGAFLAKCIVQGQQCVKNRTSE